MLSILMPIIMIVGIVFWAMAIPQLINRGTYDPTVDFEKVQGGCTVVSSRQTGQYKYKSRSRRLPIRQM